MDDRAEHRRVLQDLVSASGDIAVLARQLKAVYLAGVGSDRGIELGASKDPDVHDRFAANSSSVHLLGHSISGVAARSASTVMVEMPHTAANAQRAKIEEWWSEGELVAPAGLPPPTTASDSA